MGKYSYVKNTVFFLFLYLCVVSLFIFSLFPSFLPSFSLPFSFCLHSENEEGLQLSILRPNVTDVDQPFKMRV